MADFFESNLFRPTAPSEYLLNQPRRKKLKVEKGHLRRNKNQNHSPFGREGVPVNGAEEVPPDSRYQNHGDDRSPGLGLPAEGDQEKLTACHKTEPVAASSPTTSPGPRSNSLGEEPPNSTPPQDLKNLPGPAEEVVLLEDPSSESKPNSEESPPIRLETKDAWSSQDQPTHDDDDTAPPDPPPLSSSSTLLLENPDIHGNGAVDDLTETKSANVSDIQKRFTKLNLKRCGKDDAAALHSSADSGTEEQPVVEPEAHGQVTTTAVPPKLSETQTKVAQTTDDACPEFIDVLVTPSPKPRPPSEVVLLPFHEADETRSFSKRRRILRLLRHLFKIRLKRRGKTEEDEQALVEEEEVLLAEEEEEEEEGSSCQGEARTARHKKTKRSLGRHLAPDHNDTADPAKKKRRRPRKKNVDRATLRARKSFGRGCRYIGHGLANMTSLVPEASYLGPVSISKSYDCEYVSSDYLQASEHCGTRNHAEPGTKTSTVMAPGVSHTISYRVTSRHQTTPDDTTSPST